MTNGIRVRLLAVCGETGEIGSKNDIKKPENEWIRIPHSHPAIISREQFEIIDGMINRHRNNNISKNSNRPLNKKVWCGNCNHLLRYRSNIISPFYNCPTVNYSDKYGCAHDKIREKELNETVMFTLLTQIKFFTDNEKILRMIESKVNKPNISTDNDILQIENEIKNLQSNKRKLYERYKNEEIKQVVYLQERETLEKELENKIKESEALFSKNQIQKDVLEKTQQISQTFLKYQSEAKLTKEMADEFVESVKVYNADLITIKFKFQDELEKILKILEPI